MSQPDDMLSPHAESEIIEPPEVEDALDTAYGAAEWREAIARACAQREPEAN